MSETPTPPEPHHDERDPEGPARDGQEENAETSLDEPSDDAGGA
ncbi:hypothetical protein [Nocardioides caricicola]|uniref:Uncharacterized protein n=1 Tax=Nocardioides caricicola TaxID=634770 RepID=A0ABW0N0R0_9ACTN